MLRLLARRGYRKADSITPLEFAASIPQSGLATPVGRLTEIYQAARFGDVSKLSRGDRWSCCARFASGWQFSPLNRLISSDNISLSRLLNSPLLRPRVSHVLRLTLQREMNKSAALPKVGFVSLGCPKNLVDSEVMMGILAREGYELTPRADEAEFWL